MMPMTRNSYWGRARPRLEMRFHSAPVGGGCRCSGPGGGGQCQHSAEHTPVHYNDSTHLHSTHLTVTSLVDRLMTPAQVLSAHVDTDTRVQGSHLTEPGMTHPPYANNTPALLHIAAISQFLHNLYIYSQTRILD